MIATEIPNTFLESPDIVLSLIPDPNWYLKVDQISPTLMLRYRDLRIKHEYSMIWNHLQSNGFKKFQIDSNDFK